MQLSLRLSAIAGLVTRGNRLVDVGCDHGYLPVALYLDGKIPKDCNGRKKRTIVKSAGAYFAVWTECVHRNQTFRWT